MPYKAYPSPHTRQAEVGGDVLVPPGSGDVGDQQPDEPLALPHCGDRVLPERDRV
jgi:hypothetical protein